MNQRIRSHPRSRSAQHNGFHKISRVLIVDDQPLSRLGLLKLITPLPEVQVVGEAGSYEQALQAIAKFDPDLVTLEVMFGRASGLDLIKAVRLRFPQVQLLVISQQDEVLYAERALRAGAMGYIHKQESLANIALAVKTVLRGELYVSEQIAARIAAKIVGRRQPSAPIMDALTDRELRVFGLIGEGLGPNGIAEQLGINKSTVETYRARIKKKLRIQNADEMRQQAIFWRRNESIVK